MNVCMFAVVIGTLLCGEQDREFSSKLCLAGFPIPLPTLSLTFCTVLFVAVPTCLFYVCMASPIHLLTLKYQAHAPAHRKVHLIFKKRMMSVSKYDCDFPIHLARALDIPHLALIHELKWNRL